MGYCKVYLFIHFTQYVYFVMGYCIITPLNLIMAYDYAKKFSWGTDYYYCRKKSWGIVIFEFIMHFTQYVCFIMGYCIISFSWVMANLYKPSAKIENNNQFKS